MTIYFNEEHFSGKYVYRIFIREILRGCYHVTAKQVYQPRAF